MRKIIIVLAVALFSVFTLTSCGQEEQLKQQISDLEAKNSELQAQVTELTSDKEELEAKVEELEAQLATPTPVDTAAAVPAAVAPTTAAPVQSNK